MSLTFAEDIARESGCRIESGGFYRRGGKRAFDIVLVLLLLPIALPLGLFFCFLMKIEGGSGLYAQDRVGRGGRIFRCWKIRSMAKDADRLLARAIAADPRIAREWQVAQKLRNDPRVTFIGQFIRRSSIDELPQLWNVLIGDMSLIGPRPFTPDQREDYERGNGDPAYYRLLPGISGLWQVEMRNQGSFQDRVAFDERYARQMNFALDMKIAARTLVAVLRATGS